MKIIARSKYDAYEDKGVKCTLEEKITKQSFTDDCDVNKIIEKFARTGQLPEQKQKMYGDFSNVQDLVTAFNVVQRANESFMSLDAQVRAKFNNDPIAFVEFAQDSKNNDELKKMGLSTKQEEKIVKTDSGVKEAPLNPEVSK